MESSHEDSRARRRVLGAQLGEPVDELAPQRESRHVGAQRALVAQCLPIEGVLEHQSVQRGPRHAEIDEGFCQVTEASTLREGGEQALSQALIAALHHREQEAIQRAEVMVQVPRGVPQQRAEPARREVGTRQATTIQRIQDLLYSFFGARHNSVT